MGRIIHDYPIIWRKIKNVWNHQPDEHDLGILLILLNSAILLTTHLLPSSLLVSGCSIRSCKTSLDANAHVVAVRTSEYEFLQSSVFSASCFFFKAGHCQFWELGTKWYTTLAESTQFAQPNVSRLPCSLSQRVDRTCCLHIGFLAPWRISLSTRTNSVKS